MSRLPPVPAALLALDAGIALASVPPSRGHEPLYDTVLYPLNGVVLGLAGLLILSRFRRHAIGLLMTGLGLLAVVTEFTEGYGYHSEWPAAQAIQWISQWTSIIGATSTGVILLLFPNGHLPSRRWRPLLWVSVAAVVLGAVSYAFGHAGDNAFTTGSNPYAIEGPVMPVLAVIADAAWLISLGAIAALAVRFRRAPSAEREQIKWVAYVVLLLAIVGPFAVLFYYRSPLVRAVIAVTVVLWPIAICVAILRYRLYEIDRLISRTIAWVVLTAVVAATYAAIALGLGGLLGGRHSSYVTAAATLAAAAVFLPLRSRIQDVVDRRFRRRRHESLARIDAFLTDLRTGQAVPEGLEEVLRDVLRDPSLTVGYRLPDGRAIDPYGALTTANDRPGTVFVERNGVRLAAVHAQPPADDEPGLLADVLEHAGLAFEIARLRAEVSHQLAQVQASRTRIVAAQIEERRRLERDLHDGAQQSLVSAGLTLRLAQFGLGEDPQAVREHLDSAVGQIAQAIAELRELANGIRPARLDAGLHSALSDLAGRMQLPIDVHVGEERYPAAIEETAYFVACEALANAAKHAAASAICVQTAREEDWLVLTIRDDGTGSADAQGGSGLRGLGDRVAAVGGRLSVQSPPGIGTTLVAHLPCA